MTVQAGEIHWADLDPIRGTEQAGRRPVLVVSAEFLHRISARVIVCPISRRIRGWPTTVALPSGLRTGGEVLLDQIRAIDREQRLRGLIEAVPPDTLAEVRLRLAAILAIDP